MPQAIALLRYSKSRNYDRDTTFYGIELGEELTRFHVGTDAYEHYVKAYHECADLVRSIYSSHNRRPLLMGSARVVSSVSKSNRGGFRCGCLSFLQSN